MSADLMRPPAAPPPPVAGALETGGDSSGRLQVLFYGEDEGFLRDSFDQLKPMADSFGGGAVDVCYFSTLEELDERLKKYVHEDTNVLVALTYVLTRQNVSACLKNFLDLASHSKGFDSTSQLEERCFLDSKGISMDWMPQSLIDEYGADNVKDILKGIRMRLEPRGRIVHRLNCFHSEGGNLSLGGDMNLVLDRWEDLGKEIRGKFSGVDDFLCTGREGVDLIYRKIFKDIAELPLWGNDPF